MTILESRGVIPVQLIRAHSELTRYIRHYYKECKDFRSVRAGRTLTWRTGCEIVRGQIRRRSCGDGYC